MVTDGATPYSTMMFREEAIHRYNAGDGGSLNAYWEWLGGDWMIVSNGGAPDYVPNVLDQDADCP